MVEPPPQAVGWGSLASRIALAGGGGVQSPPIGSQSPPAAGRSPSPGALTSGKQSGLSAGPAVTSYPGSALDTENAKMGNAAAGPPKVRKKKKKTF